MSRRKQISRRRIKRRFLAGRWIALQDVVRCGLDEFVESLGYECSYSRFVRRRLGPICVVLDDVSERNLIAAFTGEMPSVH